MKVPHSGQQRKERARETERTRERELSLSASWGGGTPTNFIMTSGPHHTHPPESWQNCLLSSLAVDAGWPPRPLPRPHSPWHGPNSIFHPVDTNTNRHTHPHTYRQHRHLPIFSHFQFCYISPALASNSHPNHSIAQPPIPTTPSPNHPLSSRPAAIWHSCGARDSPQEHPQPQPSAPSGNHFSTLIFFINFTLAANNLRPPSPAPHPHPCHCHYQPHTTLFNIIISLFLWLCHSTIFLVVFFNFVRSKVLPFYWKTSAAKCRSTQKRKNGPT